MANITFITKEDEHITVDVTEGNLMEAAANHGIDSIEGDCGGVFSCGTCHVHIAKEWSNKLKLADQTEQDMLSFAENLDEYSRLSCQIEVTDKIDGLIVHL
jgi:ferredoxin, 2Fe-2S